MGRRELVLIIGFVAAGLVVWQLTAPASSSSFSFNNWFDEVRREIRGREASASVTSTPDVPVDGVKELRLSLGSTEVTVVGESRADASAELMVESNGYDEAEAKKLASSVRMKVDRFGDSVTLSMEYPEPGRQQARIRLAVPAGLQLRIEGRTRAEIEGMSSAIELSRSSGSLKVTGAGSIRGEHRGGELLLTRVGPVDLTVQSADLELEDASGELRVDSRNGDVRLKGTRGPATFIARGGDFEVSAHDGPVRVECVDADTQLLDVGARAEIEARECQLDVTWATAAAAEMRLIESSARLTLPSAPVGLDVIATGGEITAPERFTIETRDTERRLRATPANAPVITIKSDEGRLTIR